MTTTGMVTAVVVICAGMGLWAWGFIEILIYAWKVIDKQENH